MSFLPSRNVITCNITRWFAKVTSHQLIPSHINHRFQLYHKRQNIFARLIEHVYLHTHISTDRRTHIKHPATENLNRLNSSLSRHPLIQRIIDTRNVVDDPINQKVEIKLLSALETVNQHQQQTKQTLENVNPHQQQTKQTLETVNQHQQQPTQMSGNVNPHQQQTTRVFQRSEISDFFLHGNHILHDTLTQSGDVSDLGYYYAQKPDEMVLMVNVGVGTTGHMDIIHGGIISLLMDDAFSALASIGGHLTVTKTLAVKYLEPIKPKSSLFIMISIVDEDIDSRLRKVLKMTGSIYYTPNFGTANDTADDYCVDDAVSYIKKEQPRPLCVANAVMINIA